MFLFFSLGSFSFSYHSFSFLFCSFRFHFPRLRITCIVVAVSSWFVLRFSVYLWSIIWQTVTNTSPATLLLFSATTFDEWQSVRFRFYAHTFATGISFLLTSSDLFSQLYIFQCLFVFKLACSFDRPLPWFNISILFLFSTKIYTFIFQFFFFFLLINMILYLLLNRVLCFAMLFFLLCVYVFFFFIFKVHNLPDVVHGVVRNADDKNFWFPLFSSLCCVCKCVILMLLVCFALNITSF